MAGNPKVRGIDEKTMLQQVLLRKHGPLPLRSMLVYKTAMCRKHKRKIGYICTLRLPLTHPDQDFQGKRCDNKIRAERSAASECLRFIVDETELATTSTFDWKSHLNILLMQRLNQSDITGSDNINYQVVKLDENSVVLYMAKLTLPRLLPGLEYFGDLSRSKKQAEQSVAEKLASNPEAMNRVLLACNDMNNIDGGLAGARRQANRNKKWSNKYKGQGQGQGQGYNRGAGKSRSGKHTGHPHSKYQHSKYAHNKLGLPDDPPAPPPLPPVPKMILITPESQSRYRYREEHLQWKDLIVSDKVPMPAQIYAYHTALQRNLIMVLPRGFGRTFIAGMVMHRMLLSTAFGSSTAPKSGTGNSNGNNTQVMGVLQRRVSYAVMVVADTATAYAQRDKLAADTGLRVFAVGTYSDAVAMCGKVQLNEFDLLVISGDLLLHHLQLGVCAALQVVNTCVIVFYECLHHHFVHKIMHIVKCCPVKPRLLAVTADPAAVLPHSAATTNTSNVNGTAINTIKYKYAPSERQIATQITTLQWILMDCGVYMPVLPPPVVNIETVLLDRELPPTQPPLPPPIPTEARPTPPPPPERPAPPPPLPPTVLPIGKTGLVKMALMASIGCYSSEEESDSEDSAAAQLAASDAGMMDNAVQCQSDAEQGPTVDAVGITAAEGADVGDMNVPDASSVASAVHIERPTDPPTDPPTEPATEPASPGESDIAYLVVQELLTAVTERQTTPSWEAPQPDTAENTTAEDNDRAELTPLQQLTALLTEASSTRALGNMLIYVDTPTAARTLQEGLQQSFPLLDCAVLCGAYDELQPTEEQMPPGASLGGAQENIGSTESTYYGEICIDSDAASTSDVYYGEIDIDDICIGDGTGEGGDWSGASEGAHTVVGEINVDDIHSGGGCGGLGSSAGDADAPAHAVSLQDTLLALPAEEVAVSALLDMGGYCSNSDCRDSDHIHDTESECGSDASSVDLHVLYAHHRKQQDQQQDALQTNNGTVLDGSAGAAELDAASDADTGAGFIGAVDLAFLGIPTSFLGAAPWEATGDTAMEKLFAGAHHKVAICTISALCDGQLAGLAHMDLSFVVRLSGDTSYLQMIQNLCGLQKSAVHFAQKTRYVAILSAAEQRQFELRQRANAVVRRLFALD